ncbi:hypothetical protein WMY93_002688 [Mugilogobius chulae]|uniref:Transcription factor 20 n=1 Tax=Mugilogobius chulae TaxID=88201 RepID=A0AAW0PXV1_9GOBI
MTDDYAGMQQQSLHRGHSHPSQASHMLAYSSRNRGAVELPPTHASMHSGNSNNPYRKTPMEYYFSVGGKDRSRTMGMGFGTSFGYTNMDGHISHQYRPTGSGSTPPVGLMSPYPADYGSTAGGGAGAGAFSPSHQYNMAQNPAMQSVPSSQMQNRQHGQTFPSVHQQHRNYPQSGHRMATQYPQYSPQGGGSTGSSGMYSPPPQRYLDGAATTGFDPKINSSPSVNAASNSGSVASNNVVQMENVQQSYHASNYAGYSLQAHSLHKQATLQHRSSQHNLGVGYDNSLKMQHQGSSSGTVYAKHQQPSNSSIPQTSSLELAKSPMPPNAQQTQMNQNFSPISNPSPAASAVHSPSCSSSPSPLMGVSEAHGNPSGHGPSHPPVSNPRSNHGHARLLQNIPQLSPTPNSNSSISSCGSNGSLKAQSMTAVGGNVPQAARNKMGLGAGIGQQDESPSLYSSHNKMPDSSLNSLNALSSQVANLPHTVQHMMLTDTVLSQKRGKDEQLPTSHPRSRNASATSTTSTMKDVGLGIEGGPEEEPFLQEEHGRLRQMSGASSGSEPNCNPPARQSQPQANNGTCAKEANESESKIMEAVVKQHSPPSSCSLPNSISEHEPGYNENGVSLKKNAISKNEIMKNATDDMEKKQKQGNQNVDIKTQNSQDKESKLQTVSRLQNNEREEKHTFEEQQSASNVGVIVSARSEASLNEKNKQMQESTEEKQLHSRESSNHNGICSRADSEERTGAHSWSR